MMSFIALLLLLGAGAFAVQVLRSVDLPKYRGLIVKVLAAMIVPCLLVVIVCLVGMEEGLAKGRYGDAASVALGALGALVCAWRAFHYHAMRREIDLPTGLSGGPDPHLEGPAAQAAKRKAARMAKPE